MTSEGEKWEIIENYPNYFISTFGRIKSAKNNKILKPYVTKRGYSYIMLSKNGKVKNFQVHRLVAKTFIDNPLNKPCVNHIDFNPSNNNVDNLEWVTHSENCLWSSKNISLSHKGKEKTAQHKKAIRKSMLSSKNSKHYIYKNGNGYMFRFRPSKNEDINKTFKTLQDAINYRDDYFKREEKYAIK